MQVADVRPFPVDRATVRRLAWQHAEEGIPMASMFEGPDQLAYEHAYNERARQIAGEIAECA